jgi:hypothetical protein
MWFVLLIGVAVHVAHAWTPLGYELSVDAMHKLFRDQIDLQSALNQINLGGAHAPAYHYGVIPTSCIKTDKDYPNALEWMHQPFAEYDPTADPVWQSNWAVNGPAATHLIKLDSPLTLSILNSSAVDLHFQFTVTSLVPVLARPASMKCVTTDEVVCQEGGHCEHVYNTKCTCMLDNRDVCTGDGVITTVYQATIPTFLVESRTINIGVPILQQLSNTVHSPCQPRGIRDEVLAPISNSLQAIATSFQTQYPSLISPNIPAFFSSQVAILFNARTYVVNSRHMPVPVNFGNVVNSVSISTARQSFILSVNASVDTSFKGQEFVFPESPSLTDADLRVNCWSSEPLEFSRICASSGTPDVIGWLSDTFGTLQTERSGLLFKTNLTASSFVTRPITTIVEGAMGISIAGSKMKMTCPHRDNLESQSVVTNLSMANLAGTGYMQVEKNETENAFELFYQISAFDFSRFQLVDIHPDFGLSHTLITRITEYQIKKNIQKMNAGLKVFRIPFDPVTNSLLCNPKVKMHVGYFTIESTTNCAKKIEKKSLLVSRSLASKTPSCSSLLIDVFSQDYDSPATL